MSAAADSVTRVTSRFDRNATAMDVVRGIDLSGKTALVTGGASGIGHATACALAAAGADLIVADLDGDKADAAIAAFLAGNPRAKMRFARLDLGSLKSVRLFAGDFTAQVPSLDILVNNAGIMACPQGETADGHELQFGINFLGHYLLSRLLEPVLVKAGRARVVTVASIGHRRSDIHYDDIDYKTRPYDRWEAYGQSKTACSLLAIALDQQWKAQGIRSNTLNPGGSPTGLHQFLTDEERRKQGWLSEEGKVPARWRSPEQCAATSAWLASSPELEGVGGRYFEECQEALPWREDEPMAGVKPYAIDPANARRLWDVAGTMTGL
ncbi:MAG: SDR family NAD(P)-dependent oxidoreductase [Comamonadaceae bacterium]|nr:MAG: SDR family NAD(P)-dependent oxidoreductase [Comamonadaceae bacterium]